MDGIYTTNRAEYHKLTTIAWQFLCSQYTGANYWNWPLDKRLDAFLRHHHRGDIINNGNVYSAVLELVMSNLSRARRNGVLA